MSARSKALRRRERDEKRASSGFMIESIRVGLIEHLAHPLPAETFSPRYERPMMGFRVHPHVPVTIKARRRSPGFDRPFLAGLYFYPEGSGPQRAHFAGLQSHIPVEPNGESEVVWIPTMAGTVQDIVMPEERLTPSKRRKLAARGRR